MTHEEMRKIQLSVAARLSEVNGDFLSEDIRFLEGVQMRRWGDA